MKLYLALFRISVQDSIQNRVESAIWFLYETLPPLMMAALWLAAYEGQASVGGYSLPEMLGYTVGVMVLRTVVTSHIEYAIDDNIRQGTLSTYLVRPMNVWGFWLVDSLGWKTFRNLLTVPALIIALIWLGPELVSLNVPLERLPVLLLSVLLAAAVCFFLKLCLGFVAFWTNDIVGVSTVYEVVAGVFGGVLVPLALLPGWLQQIAHLLPIQAIYHMPLAVLLGKSEGAALWWGLTLQLAWVGILWALALVMWRAGLRQYESVGG